MQYMWCLYVICHLYIALFGVLSGLEQDGLIVLFIWKEGYGYIAALPLQRFLRQVNLKISGGDIMKEYNYTGDKVKNHFTAYLQEFIRYKRRKYLKKSENISDIEKPLKDMQRNYNITIEELLEMRQREKLLSREQHGSYPRWRELSDQRLIQAILLLNEEERRFIYQHVFEERTFKEIGHLTGLADTRIKSTYYYAIEKIRKYMGGE